MLPLIARLGRRLTPLLAGGWLLAAAAPAAFGQLARVPNTTMSFPADSTGVMPATLSATGALADLATLAPNTGVVPFAPKVAFWSDYAIKSRWFALTNLTDTVTFARDGNWTFPAGMIWVKHFEMEMTRGDPSTRRRLETRFLIKTAASIYGLTYIWRPDQTEADLAPSGGVSETLTIDVGGVPTHQLWRYPSRNQCLSCHTPAGGFALGFNTRQMNAPHAYGAVTLNQIQALSDAGYFSAPVTEVKTLPAYAAADDESASREFRVRSFLAVNCAQCHQPAGPASSFANWDARATTLTDDAEIINGLLQNDNGDPDNRWAAPGNLGNSVALQRLLHNPDFTQMPPIATSVVNEEAVQLISDWILHDLPSRENFTQWQVLQFISDEAPAAQPDADPDNDGQTNRQEFLARTNPNDPASRWNIAVQPAAGGGVQVGFTQPANRGVLIETSTDLQNWILWDVLDNQAEFPAEALERALTAPLSGPRQFFRARLLEL